MFFEPVSCEFVAQMKGFLNHDFDVFLNVIWFQRDRECADRNAQQLARWRQNYGKRLIMKCAHDAPTTGAQS